jgi:hypothetical protein
MSNSRTDENLSGRAEKPEVRKEKEKEKASGKTPVIKPTQFQSYE